ncbi:MAG TPA: hypothetical protein VNS33_17830 [Bradyrhizobium sp.]|nr:hypothetical protein [Bradyrhizobium sp.]
MEAMVEETVMEAIVERGSRKPRREAGMGKRRACETTAAEMHAAGMHASAHAADMHAATHAAMHPAAHTATVHAATATTAPSECRWRKGKRRRERTRHEVTKDPAVHPNSSFVIEWPRRMPLHEDDDREMIQRFQLTNATVSDAEVRFASSQGQGMPASVSDCPSERKPRQSIAEITLSRVVSRRDSATTDNLTGSCATLQCRVT